MAYPKIGDQVIVPDSILGEGYGTVVGIRRRSDWPILVNVEGRGNKVFSADELTVVEKVREEDANEH